MQKTLEQLQETAVNEALAGNWKKAVHLNQEIIDIDPRHTDSYLRLGFANMQLGKLDLAKKAYVKALRLQPTNQIAKNNLAKIKILEKKAHEKSVRSSKEKLVDPNLFINIPGRTKVVTLINIGQADVLAKLQVGQSAILKIKKRHVEVRTESGEYIGALPDDISRRMIFFIQAKSEFSVFIKEASKNSVDIFARVEKMGRKAKKYASFPKNIQDNLKVMAGDDETKLDEGTVDNEAEELTDTEAPVDLEELAEQVEESEYYGHVNQTETEDEEEE